MQAYAVDPPGSADMSRVKDTVIGPLGFRMRAKLPCLILLFLTFNAASHAGEAAIAYCPKADKASSGFGTDADAASQNAIWHCQISLHIEDEAPKSCCEVIVSTSYTDCVAFAGKNPIENLGYGDDKEMAANTAVISCEADCLGYNGGEVSGQQCYDQCVVRSVACRSSQQ